MSDKIPSLKTPPPKTSTESGSQGPPNPTNVAASIQGKDVHLRFATPTTRGQPPPPPTPQHIVLQGLGGSGCQPAAPPQPPRVGGVIQLGPEQWDVYTGGSNIAMNNPCTYTTQRRPTKFESVSAFEALLDKGMEQKLAAPDTKSSEVTLTVWFTHLATHLVRLGLDTIFCIPIQGREVYIAEEWGHFRAQTLHQRATMIQNGIGGNPPCPYDLKNLDYSGKFLLASLIKSYKYTILEELGPAPNGLEVFAYIVKTCLIKAISCQRELITKLASLKLSDQEGENVRKFNVKLRDCCREIEQTGPPPRDLAFMVSCTYVSSQVPFFATKMLDVQLLLENNPGHHTWQQVLELALNHYLAMDTFWTPAGNSLSTQNSMQAEIKSLRQSLNALKLKVPGAKASTPNPPSKKDKICFDCGAKNQARGHEGCPHKGEKLFLPERFKKKKKSSTSSPSSTPASTPSTPSASTPSNAISTSEEDWPSNDEKLIDGKPYVLCRKCFNKFKKKYGRWYAADAANAHKTNAHRSKTSTQSNQNLALVNPQSVLSQVMEPPGNSSPANPSPDLLQICSLTGLTLDELIHKVNSAVPSPVSPPSASIPSASPPSVPQREDKLELTFGLLDDYTDIPDEVDVAADSDIATHWFEDCANLKMGASANVSMCFPADPEIDVCRPVSSTPCSAPVHVVIDDSSSESVDVIDDSAAESADSCTEPLMVLEKPYSNWYCVDNYLLSHLCTHLLILSMFLVTFLHPHCFRFHLSLCILTLISSYHLLDKSFLLWNVFKNGFKIFLSSGPTVQVKTFCYPEEFLLLSCVMLLGTFVHMYCNLSFLAVTLTLLMSNMGIVCRQSKLIYHRSSSKLKSYLSHKYSLSPKKCAKLVRPAKHPSKVSSSKFACLAVLNALGTVLTLPTISMGKDMALHNQLRKHVNYMGHLNVKNLSVPQLASLQEYLVNDLHASHDILEGAFPFIVDTGCACSCSPHKEDFEWLKPLPTPIILKGVTGEQKCTHGGSLKLQCINENGDVVTLRTPAYHNPHQHVRLFSPQCHFKVMLHHKGSLLFSWAKSVLQLPDLGNLPLHIDKTSHMPILTCFHDVEKSMKHLANPCVTDEVNPMLSPKSKLLLKLHYKLGHLGFSHLKYLLRAFKLFGSAGIMASEPTTDIPKCSSCIEGGMEKLPIKGNIHTKVPHHQGSLKREQLIPGQRIFSDQYVSSLTGKNFTGKGHLNCTRGFKGGTIFCDAASSYISIHHQQSFTGHETIQSMLTFERESADIGNTIQGYNTDNGVYTAKALMSKLQSNNQTLRLSGVGAHHHNGVAENAIKNMSRKARVFMFHAALRWPTKFDKSLWPLAMSHAAHLHNHTPRQHDGLAPIEIWTKSKSTHTQLINAHPWGVPAYVLNSKIQDGFKIPRFDPRSMQGVYVGQSPLHASSVGLILNTRTNRISPQFHVIYDDYFETVPYNAEEPPPKWSDLVIENFESLDVEENPYSPQTDNGWETADENLPQTSAPSSSFQPQSIPMKEPLPEAVIRPPSAPDPLQQREVSPPKPLQQREPLPMKSPVVSPPSHVPVPDEPHPVTVPQDTSVPQRRSSRDRRPVERFKFDKAHGYFTIKKFFKSITTLCCLFPDDSSAFNANYAYALALDCHSGIVTNTSMIAPDFLVRNPNLFKAGKKDADSPGIMEALSGPYRDDFLQGMKNEIQELETHGTWTIMKREDIPKIKLQNGTFATPKILSGTWAFRIKRFPDGIMKKIKARFCVRGDLQTDVDVFDTYAPVASWKSIRMLTILALQNNWDIKQIDFSNAFVQAPMERDVYISLPQLFTSYNGTPASELCMKLNKSLYGLREAPKLWNDHLAKALHKAGFSQSAHDPGVYYGHGMALAVYVDDVLLFGPCAKEMSAVIKELQLDGFDLKIEKEAKDSSFDFLGVHIERFKNKEGVQHIKMTQHGLIKKFLETVDMMSCNPKDSPCNVQPLGTDKNGKHHYEPWDYASAVGMLMYLAGNAYPEIQFAVHQCARFCHAPRHSHAIAVKRIAHYLKGILNKQQGLIFKATPDQRLDMFVDADFAGLWGYEDDQDPVCVKSRTGYVMTLGDCPLHWCSKLQTEIATSTLEAEYIALAQGMRELAPICCIFVEMLREFKLIGPHEVPVKSCIFEDNNSCIATCTAPKLSPRTKHIAVKYHFVRNFFTPDASPDTPYVLEKIHTDEQKADIFTKGLAAPKFLELRALLCGY